MRFVGLKGLKSPWAEFVEPKDPSPFELLDQELLARYYIFILFESSCIALIGC